MKNFFLTALVILAACTGTEKPEGLIEPDQMARVMMEVHLLESKVSQIPIEPYDSVQAFYDHYEALLFEDLGITNEQYELSFNYYVDHPVEFEKIYSVVVDSLNQREKISR